MDPDFHLIETMRSARAGVALLELHLDRLRRSAAHFGIGYDEAYVRACIDAATAPADGACRVRLTLDAGVDVQVQVDELKPWPDRPRCALRKLPPIEDPGLLQHKTNRRSAYEAAYREAREEGFDEVLFVNRAGLVTEGSRTNVFVRITADNTYCTPPVECGLLPGVYRRHLLDTLPGATERRLAAGDLPGADAVLVCNALRGCREVALDEIETFHQL